MGKSNVLKLFRFACLLCVMGLGLITIIGTGGGGGGDDATTTSNADDTESEETGGEESGGTDSTFPNDGACDGPAVGQSPNDSDNTFLSLAVHPTDPNTLVIGNEGNGIFKSTDGGATWSRINNGIYYQPVGNGTPCRYPEFYEIIFDWNDPNKLYAATTNGPEPATSGTTSAGFYYSTNGGASWTQSNSGLHNYALMSVAQDPANPNVLYLGTDNARPSSLQITGQTTGSNIYKSTDGGRNWTGLNLPVTNNRVTHIVIDPTDSAIVYCAGFDTAADDRLSPTHLGIAKSTDGGLTWTRINTGLAALSNPSILMDPNDASTLYATVWTSQGALTYKSIDGGANWAQYSGHNTVNNLSNVRVSPHRAGTLIGFTTQKIHTSIDGGSNWGVALDFSSSSVIFKEIVFTSDADTIYGSSDQLKVYRSTDGGVTFSAVSGDIQVLIGH